MQGPREHVSLTCRFNDKYLVVEASVSPNWHLYSVTQPDGATIRATFEFELPELKLLEIRPTTEPHINDSPDFDVNLEEHDNAVTWIFTFQDKLPPDNTIKGKLRGQVCDASTCVPITVEFEAVFDPDLDISPLKTQAASVADRFVVRLGTSGDEIKSPSEVVEVRGTVDFPQDMGQEGNANTFSIQDMTFSPQETVNITSLWLALVCAFLGGMILNIMPCVLPIIGLKILSFFEQAGKSRAKAFMLNTCYSLGILSVFLFLAFLSLGLSILFTFDLFNIIMACVVFVMALSLMDVWTLNVPGILGGKTSGKLTSQEGVVGAFFKGIITTLLAIPCGAPLLSPAVNWADIQIRSGNMPEVFLMYAVIGLGMASPYLLLGAFPEWLRFLPKP